MEAKTKMTTLKEYLDNIDTTLGHPMNRNGYYYFGEINIWEENRHPESIMDEETMVCTRTDRVKLNLEDNPIIDKYNRILVIPILAGG